MLDRQPIYPGRITLLPVDDTINTYDVERADEPTQEGDPLNKNTFLKDETANLFGLEKTAVPDDVFRKIHRNINYKEIGRVVAGEWVNELSLNIEDVRVYRDFIIVYTAGSTSGTISPDDDDGDTSHYIESVYLQISFSGLYSERTNLAGSVQSSKKYYFRFYELANLGEQHMVIRKAFESGVGSGNIDGSIDFGDFTGGLSVSCTQYGGSGEYFLSDAEIIVYAR